MQNFRDLIVWEKGHLFTLAVYQATRNFPKQELFGLTSQIRRSSASVPANIAEGCGRTGDPELRRFCLIAMGSASELEYHLLLARDLNYLVASVYKKLDAAVTETKRMLASLINKLRD